MLELSSLDAGIQALVLVGFSVVLAAALLLTLTGLNLPQVQLFELGGQTYSIALIFLWAVIFLFSIGWGYLLAAVVGSSKWLRWPALGLFTIALLYQVVSTLSNAQTHGIQLDALLVLQIAAPQLALLVPVWTIAAFRAIAKRPGITQLTVLGTIGSVLLYFGVYYSMLQVAGESNLGLPVTGLMPISLTLLYPLYLLAGVDLSELLFLTGVGAWAWCGSWLGRRASRLLVLVVAASGLAVEGILDRGAFLRFGSLAYAAAWMVANLLFLRWVIPRVMISQAASYPLLFLVVIVAWFGGGSIGLPVPPLLGSVPNAVSVTGAGCLPAAAALWLRFRWRLMAAILLLGVMGIWMLFSHLPALFGISISPGDLLGKTVVGSSLALTALIFAAEKYAALALWRTVGTVWTLGMTLMDAYRLAVIHGANLYDVLPAVQVGILLVALGLALTSIPRAVRIAGVGLALVGLLGSVYVARHGGPLP